MANILTDLAARSGDCNTTAMAYLHADHLGRPVFATDTEGEIIWDGGITTPFGVQIETLGALTQNLMFPGQYEDEETGFYYNWHRTYDPTLGRYLQSDPIGLAGGLNRYAYVGGNPMNAIDPMGLDSLFFNGTDLLLLDDDNFTILKQWNAVSGFQPNGPSNKRGCGCFDEQEKEGRGPIPNGVYTVSRWSTSYRKKFGKIRSDKEWGPRVSWGDARTEIKPKPGTNTFGRHSMYMHGGTVPGSAGCVDLTGDNDDFHKWLKSKWLPVDLTVRNIGTPSPIPIPSIKR